MYTKFIKELEKSNYETTFFNFTVGEIYNMARYLFKKLSNERFKDSNISKGLFNNAIRKLKIRNEIINEHQNNINEIIENNKNIFENKYNIDNKFIYVYNYNGSGDGPSIFSTNWDGTISINIKYFEYLNVSYNDYIEYNGYYFYKAHDLIGIYLVFDKKGDDYLRFGQLNKEQKDAKKFINFIGETYKSLNIQNKFNLSKLLIDVIQGRFGDSTLNYKSDCNYDSAIVTINTLKGKYTFNCSFSQFHNSTFLRNLREENDCLYKFTIKQNMKYWKY